MKALLKKICITKNEVKREDMLADLDRYMDNIRGILVRNDIRFAESDTCIEISTPTEIEIRKPSSTLCGYVIYTYVIRFEDEQEKKIFKDNIYSVEKDGTTWIKYANHIIGLPKDWMDKDEVEALVHVEPFGLWNVMKEVIEEIERSTDNLEKVYTIRLPQWLIKKLRNMDTNVIRDSLTKLVEGYTMVQIHELDNIKNSLEITKKILSERENKLSSLSEKYDILVRFIREKGLSEEFKQFVKEELEKQSEEEIKNRYSEIFEEE